MDLPVLSDTGEALAHAQEIMDVYCKALPLSKGLDEKERGPADELPVVAAAGLIRAFRSAGPEDASPLPLLQASRSCSHRRSPRHVSHRTVGL